MSTRHHEALVPAPREPAEERVTTPFEDWCESTGTHPEAHGAWERFTQSVS